MFGRPNAVSPPMLSTQDSDRTMAFEAHSLHPSLDSAPSSTSISPRLYSTMRCPDCQSDAPMLLNENHLYQKGILSFVQLYPCGHTYCTRCFEKIIIKAASTSIIYLLIEVRMVGLLVQCQQHSTLFSAWR